MKKRLLTIGAVLGGGTLAYWCFREFQKSDRTYKGFVSQMGDDIKSGYRTGSTSARGLFHAVQTGLRHMSEERAGTDNPLQRRAILSVGITPNDLDHFGTEKNNQGVVVDPNH